MSANVAGLAGAVAMMGVALASRKLGVTGGEMLPKQTVESALHAANQEQETTEQQEKMLGMGTHIGFSLSSAMLYSRVRHFVSLPGPVVGALFGLALWGVNVAGVAPMVGIRNAPWEQDEARAITTIASHLVFGLVLGALYDTLISDEGGR